MSSYRNHRTAIEVGVPESLMPKRSLQIPRKMALSVFPRSVTRRDLCPLAKPTFSASDCCVDLLNDLLGTLQATYSGNVVLNGGQDPIITLLLCFIVSDLPQNLGWPQIVSPVLKVTLS